MNNIMKPLFKVTEISVEDLRERKEKEYNERVWNESIDRYSKYPSCKFYVVEPDKNYSYARFYASYIADGIYFFKKWDGYGAMISNNGFCQIHIDSDGVVHQILFKGMDGEGYAENNKHNRNLFRKNLTPLDIMVSNDF